MCFCAETIEIWKTEAFKFQKEEEAEQKCSPKKWSQRKEGRLGQKKKIEDWTKDSGSQGRSWSSEMRGDKCQGMPRTACV